MSADIDVGKITESLNNKVDLVNGVPQDAVDYVVAMQRPTAENNYTWYRKYKSGWVEQGGVESINVSSGTSITLPVVMLDTNYTVIITNTSYVSGTGKYETGCERTSTSQILIKSPGASGTFLYSWRVSGMAA